MNDLFAPPGNVWKPISPALGRLRHLLLSVVAVVLLAAVVTVGLLVDLPTLVVVLVAFVVVALSVVAWAVIGRNARSWGYAERDEELYIKHGAMFRELVAVPYGRMQFVDINSGPLDQLFGIASVHLHTASPGTSARIPGLPKDEAARLRDRLTSLGESQAAGL